MFSKTGRTQRRGSKQWTIYPPQIALRCKEFFEKEISYHDDALQLGCHPSTRRIPRFLQERHQNWRGHAGDRFAIEGKRLAIFEMLVALWSSFYFLLANEQPPQS